MEHHFQINDNVWSPSLRGSGLKSIEAVNFKDRLGVSLFTREWIEMTRPEWTSCGQKGSPSLRGSGLK